MSNHIHLLIKEQKEPIEQIIKRIATRFVYWYNIKYRRAGHLFQDRFKSEPVESDSYFLTVLRYIHQNPVKACMCKKPQDYKYSSYNEFFVDSDFLDKSFVFNLIPQETFSKFNTETTRESCLDIKDDYRTKVTEEEARRIFEQISKCKNVAEFQALDIKSRDKYLMKLKSNGLSIRQINRLTGTSYYVVQKACVNHRTVP